MRRMALSDLSLGRWAFITPRFVTVPPVGGGRCRGRRGGLLCRCAPPGLRRGRRAPASRTTITRSRWHRRLFSRCAGAGMVVRATARLTRLRGRVIGRPRERLTANRRLRGCATERHLAYVHAPLVSTRGTRRFPRPRGTPERFANNISDPLEHGSTGQTPVSLMCFW